MLKIIFRAVWVSDGSRMNLSDTGIVVASEKDGKYNHLKSLGFVWREPFRTLFDIKLIQEISEIEAENPKNKQWHARRDLLGTLKRVYEDTESLNMLKGWRLSIKEATYKYSYGLSQQSGRSYFI